MIHTMKNYKRVLASLGLATVMTVAVAAPALAAETDMTVGITGTPREVTIGPLAFENADLNFSLDPQTVTTNGAEGGSPALLTVTDMSGTGDEWTVYAQSDGLVSGDDTIPASAITVTPGNLDTDDGATLGDAGTLGAQLVVMSAASGAGDGIHTADLDVTIAVPGSQRAGTYEGKLTVTDTVDIP